MNNNDNLFLFEDIPPLEYDPNIRVDENLILTNEVLNDTNYTLELQRFTNTLISLKFPFVSAVTLKCIDDELTDSLRMKIQTLDRLKKKYNRRTRNINYMHDIIIDDFEMYIDDNVQLIPNAQVSLMKTTVESSLIQIIFKQFEVGDNAATGDFQDIYKLLRKACNYHFTQLYFGDESQRNLSQRRVYRIVQVWQIFQQYFQQFDYLDYLNNYYSIKQVSDTKTILNIIRILIEVGSINC